jgi:CheY-like chemotaxis protein
MIIKRVLFVDDEAFFSRIYRQAFGQNWQVTYCERAGDARTRLLSGETFDAIILDVMMPPPCDEDGAVTLGGFETGLWLLVGVEHTLPGGVPPTLLLTNRSLEQVREGMKRRNLDPEDVRFELRFKAETPARKLPEIVEALIRRASV